MDNAIKKELDIACIVDDDLIFTRVLSKLMSAVNFAKTILTFPNGSDALKYLQSVLDNPGQLPSVILLDLNMPVLDGWQFLDEFAKCKPGRKITIYIVSSSIDKADHEKALSYEAVSRFYIKPVGKNDLLEMSADVMERALRSE